MPPDLVQDLVFGASLIIAGIDIVRSALAKAIPAALSAFIAALSVFGLFYL